MQLCRGCHVHMTHTCSFTRAEDIDKCPCKMCLIKGVCNTACEEYEHYYDVWHEKRFEQNRKRLKEIMDGKL